MRALLHINAGENVRDTTVFTWLVGFNKVNFYLCKICVNRTITLLITCYKGAKLVSNKQTNTLTLKAL